MAFLGGFNAATVEPIRAFEPIPEGKYTAIITASEMKTVKPPKVGQYLELTLQIVDGQHKGRQFWERLNLQNPSAVAVAMAQGTLSAICRAVGVLTPQDSAELHDIPLEMKLVCKKNAETGEIRNEIKGYAAIGGNGAGFAAGAAFSPPPAQPKEQAAPPAPARKSAPWAKS